MKRDVGLKLQATRALVAKLAAPRREYWTRLLDARAKVAVGAGTEWDLATANWLDGVYEAVSTEATRVRKEGTSALADVTATVGWGLWPLALAALAFAYAYRGK
jgi:hypothetical protein